LSKSQIAVQSCHAAIEVASKEKMSEHPSVILIESKSEIRLQRIKEYLTSENIKCFEFREPDIGNQLTSIATEPIIDQTTRDKLKKYQLYK